MSDYKKLKSMVKRSIDQILRLRNFDARHGKIEKEQWSRIACCQRKAKGQCSRGDKCSFRHDEDRHAKPTPKIRSTH